MNWGDGEPLFIEVSIVPPIEVNDNILLYILILCKNILLLSSTLFNKVWSRWDGACKSGSELFPFSNTMKNQLCLVF